MSGASLTLFKRKGEKVMDKAIKRYWPIFALPTMLAFTIGFIAPFVLGIYLSFCKFTTVTDAKWVGLSNYLKCSTTRRIRSFIPCGTPRFSPLYPYF